MDIVITGANGAVGTALIRYLSEGTLIGAVHLRALVRSPAGARSLHALGAEVIIIDYRQPEALRGAVTGADVAVIWPAPCCPDAGKRCGRPMSKPPGLSSKRPPRQASRRLYI